MNQNQKSFDFFLRDTPLEYYPNNIQAQIFNFEGMASEKMSISSPFSNSNLSMNKFKDVQSRGSREAEHTRNDEIPTRSTTPYLDFGVKLKEEPSKLFFNTAVKTINDHMNENKYRLLEIKVTRQIKEELKESDLVIEKEIDDEPPQMYPVRKSSMSYPTFHSFPLKNEPIKIEEVEENLQEKFEAPKNPSQKVFKPQKKTIKKPKRNKKASNKLDIKVAKKASKELNTKLARNFPKIFGQTVIRYIEGDIFSDKSLMRAIYDRYHLNDSIEEFKEWVGTLFSQYTTLPFFRKVWTCSFVKPKDKKFAEVLKEFTRLFLHREAYLYLIENSGKKFRNHNVIKEYMKCIPIFMQGVCFPENFRGLKSRIGRSF